MEESKTLITLKQGILLEKRGMEFFRTIACQVKDPKVKEFFNEMAEEEVVHLKFLTDLYNSLSKTGEFDSSVLERAKTTEIADHVLDEDMIGKIEAASFESAAIDAAINFEKKAIELYSKRAAECEDEKEKEFYTYLANWEGDHLKDLEDISEELKNKVWNDNSFWAF
ncbi:MAG: hypothetical protein CR982_07900 [Candidatus Cloacimonadota bacterium]|nr:MAG: hypothetical protein CR982_07900 [Candidatus Cloacimonadota bacterium]PIE78222.1 MAG: hypothetical protein CSA15_08640 [Candidatus Delongbacteria bacterium]